MPKPPTTRSASCARRPIGTIGRWWPNSSIAASAGPRDAKIVRRSTTCYKVPCAQNSIWWLRGRWIDWGGRCRTCFPSYPELHAKHIDLYLHQQGVDTTTPAGRALFSMCGVFAEFERSMIQERVKAGLARAKDAGKTLGRPQVSAEVEAQVRALHANGVGKVRLAKQLGIGVSAVQRIVRSSED